MRDVYVSRSRSGRGKLRFRQAIAQLRRSFAQRNHLLVELFGARGATLGRGSKLGKLRFKLLHRGARLGHRLVGLLALALHVGELAAARAERVGGSLRLGGLRVAALLGKLLRQLQAFGLGLPQRFLGRALRFLRLRVRDLRAHQFLTRFVKLARAGKHALAAGACCAHRQLAGRPHDVAIGRHEAYERRAARMRGNGRVKVLAHHHVAEQRLDGGRIFLPIGKRIHQRTPTASCDGIAGGNGRLHALPRQQHHFAGLARLQQRARKLARLIGGARITQTTRKSAEEMLRA